jgi:polygalacturonase
MTVNAMNYGLVGDGVTDNTAGFQAAINAATLAGEALAFPKRGVFKSGPVAVPSGLRIVTDSIVSLLYDSPTGDFISVNTNERFVLDGFTIAGHASATGGNLVKVTGSGFGNVGSRVTNCRFHGGYNQVQWGGFDWRTRDNSFANWKGNAIVAANPSYPGLNRAEVSSNRFTNTNKTGTCIYYPCGYSLWVKDNYAYDVGTFLHVKPNDPGVEMSGNLKVHGNEIAQATTGVYFERNGALKFANADFIGNQFYTKFGIIDSNDWPTNALADLTISANQFFPLTDGIGIALKCNPALISDNIFDGGDVTNTTGIFIRSGCFHWSVQDNKFTVITTKILNQSAAESTVKLLNNL